VRRKEKEITDRAELEAVIADAQVCRMAMCDEDQPYVIPLSFGYAEGTFYFHCAAAGRKLDVLGKNPKVCLELEAGVSLKNGAKACDWGMKFRSVIAWGSVERVDADGPKRRALDLIMAHYAPGPFEYVEAALAKTVVLQVKTTNMTGKRAG
jgi:nitroimidazol reductase NimA-like FMN-containing flavoprotein (pyridoxamine 5'-phosphate oxidase superfamily)